MIATRLVAAAGAIAGLTALAQEADPVLAWGAFISGACGVLGVPFAVRRILRSLDSSTGRFPVHAVPALLAVLAAVAGTLGLFASAMPALAWSAAGIFFFLVVLGLICGRMEVEDARWVLFFAAGLMVLAASISVLVGLWVNDRGEWSVIPIAVIALFVAAVWWFFSNEIQVRLRRLSATLRPSHHAAPGVRIPAMIGLLGPVLAVVTSVFIAIWSSTVWWGLPLASTSDVLTFTAGATLVQIAVQGLIVTALQPAVGPGEIRAVAEEARWRAGEAEHEWALRQGHSGIGGLAASSSWDRERLERRWRRDHGAAMSAHYGYRGHGLLASSRAVDSARHAARTQGVAVDDLWSGLALVLPTDVRRRLLRTEYGIALFRVAAAGAISAAAAFLLVGMFSFGAVAALVFIVAVLAGRQLVADAYATRADVSAVYRIELARTLGLRLPPTQAGLVAMGSQLAAGLLDEGPVPTELAGPSASAQEGESREVRVLRDEFKNVSAELKNGLARMERQQADFLRGVPVPDFGASELERLAELVAEHAAEPISSRVGRVFAELESSLGKSVTSIVDTAMAGPELVKFAGYLVIELAADGGDETAVESTGSGVVATPPGGSVELNISVVSDPLARDSAPNRRTAAESTFVALETVNIENGRIEPVVHFDLIIDSATMTPSPHRLPVRVTRPKGEQQVRAALQAPAGEGVYEAWVQLFQAGRLIQAVVVAVDTRGRSDEG